MTDAATLAVYEASAAEYRRRRQAYDRERAERFAAAVPAGAVRLDVGCGPGLYSELLGRPLVAGDPAMAMCREAARTAPGVPVVRFDVLALPFRPGAAGGAWVWKVLQHLDAAAVPVALAELHRALPVGGRLTAGLVRPGPGTADDDLPGRRFTPWEPGALASVLDGAGFAVDDLRATERAIQVEATRARTLPDVVGPGIRILVCGLNPSLFAADVGVPYGRPGNRFWPAALAAGLVSVDRDPWHALRHHGVGFTDLVKRATAGAAELTPDEYRAGLARVERLCELVRPAVVAFCGLTGWRHAVDRKATVGWQDRTVGGARAYVLPNPSGLNAHTNVADLARHLRAVVEG